MVTMSNLPDSELLEVAELIALKVSRPILQEALLESRLIARTTDREEVRRVARSHTTWTARVKSGLEIAERRPAALRVLRLLVNAYIKLPSIDHRVENSLRKAHLAAERGDSQRLQREIERLTEFGSDLGIIELKNPVTILAMGAASEHARDHIASLNLTRGIDEKRQFEALQAGTAPSQPPVTSAVMSLAIAASVAPETSPTLRVAIASTPQVDAGLLADLRVLALSPTPQPLQWNIAELLSQEPLPPSCVTWPTTALVTSNLRNLQQASRALAGVEIAEGDLAIESVRSVRLAVQGALGVLAQAPIVLDELNTLEHIAKEAAVAHGDALDGSAKIEAQRALALLSGAASDWREGIAALDENSRKNYDEREKLRTAILDISRTIAGLAAELPPERQNIAETKVRFLARRQRIEELRKIHDEIVEELVLVRTQRTKTQTAAKKALEELAEFAGPVPNESRDNLLAVVRRGDLKDLDYAVEEIRRHLPVQTNASPVPANTLKPSIPAVRPPIIPGQQRAIPINEVPSALPRSHALSLTVTQFTPRDRITQRTPLPNNGTELLNILLKRALQEMRRGSPLGVIDHALDILLLIRGAKDVRAWTDIGLTLLAALPATTPAFQEWGDELADDLSSDLEQDIPVFSKQTALLISRPAFADAIAERFTQKELEPLVPAIAQVLYDAVCRQSPYLLQDLAQGIADGVRFGDTATAKKLLIAIGTAHGLEPDTIGRLEAIIEGTPQDPRTVSTLKSVTPSWLLDAIHQCRTAIIEHRSATQRSATRGSFNIQVPQSVQTSGGFVFAPGTDILEVAFQVGNPQGLKCIAAELVVPAQRNTWLARDAIAYLGPLTPKARVLAPLRLHLAKELVDDQRLEIQVELRYKERDSAPSRFQDDTFTAGFRKLGIVTIQDYDGASGKPIILQGEALRLSSEGVKNALTEILHNLKRGNLTALILGRRRRGKTSILTTVAHDPEIRKNYVIIQDSVEDLPFRALGDALGHLGNILDRVARYLDITIDPIEPTLRTQPHLGWGIFQEWLATINRLLPQQKHVLLLLDEFQKWISLLDAEARTRVLAAFRGLMNRPHGEPLSIAIVLSGLTNIREYTKTSADFLNAFRVFEVKAFSAAEAAALIRSNNSIEFDARALGRISELSGGNPFLINLLGNDIAARLREHGRPYCFPDDVERVVKSQLDDRQNSRVWSFLQYLLKQGEEDHASEIVELPGLLALAWTLKTRGSRRTLVAVEEIVEELRNLDVECDPTTLTTHLEAAAQNELVTRHADRYAFASGWLGEWLGVIANEKPAPVRKAKDQDLILNRYRIVELLDRGGQGTVYVAQDTLTFDSPVVLKVYARMQGDSVSSVSEREAKALCAIQHNAVVRCYSYGTDPEMGDVLVLERVKGQTLRQLMTERPKAAGDLCGIEGNITVQVKLLEQLATALAECHSVGVVHKDLKPENILLEHSAGMWFPKIIDFGISSAPLHGNQSAAPTIGPYTPGYVAPERYRGEPRRAAADIYSLGVVAYELLTGISPFPTEPVAGMKAQEEGTFRPLRELRPTDITLRLGELVESMLSPTALERPNALTVASVLPAALQAADWKEFLNLGRKAYLEGDAEAACDHLDKAARTAKEQEHQTPEYIEVLRLLVDCARDCHKIFQIAPQLVQPMLRSVIHNHEARELIQEFVSAVLQDAHVVTGDKDAQRTTIVTLLELLLLHEPSYGLTSSIEVMLRSVNNPVVWQNRETVYEVGVNYRATSLLTPGLLEAWCIAASKLLREKNANADEPQLWLRRAERLGIKNNPEFRAEAAEVDKLLRNTANARELPPLPASQERDENSVGEDERGHLNVSRIRNWVSRVLKRHPYVQAVRRVRKDPKLALRPTRVLDVTNIAQHIVSLPKTDVHRIIPAVLDESYCIPSGATVLRVNIVLAEATTPRQRECAYERLRKDDALFGEDS